MASATVPLHDLAQRINHQEAELARLRKEFQARQAKLVELTRRKRELQDQLQKVESAMKAVGQHVAPVPVSTPTMKGAGASGNSISLPKFLVGLVLEARRPLTIKELSQEVVRRKFPTTSKNISAMVETRVSELLRKGLLKRTRDKSAIVPSGMSTNMMPMSAKTPGAAPKSSPSKPMSAPKTSGSMGANQGRKISLKESLTQVLAKSSRPLNTEELAAKVLATGYQTASKDFKNVIWVGIGAMNNVERIKGKGYRLKKGYGKK
jgi:hypothetical protein